MDEKKWCLMGGCHGNDNDQMEVFGGGAAQDGRPITFI